MPRKGYVVDKETVALVPAPTTLIPEQGLRLMEAMNGEIDEYAIQVRPGPGGRALKYIPHGYVRDQLNKVFGPFWSELPVDISPGRKYDIVEYQVERENPRTHVKELKNVREVVVMTELRIRIYDSNGLLISEESHVGSGGKIWENNISFADTLQSAQSESLKRSAFTLGRKFGLQLYYDSEERRAEWQERFAPPPPPDNVGKLLGAMDREKITNEMFKEIIGYDLGDLDESGNPMPREKDVPKIWEQLMEALSVRRDEG